MYIYIYNFRVKLIFIWRYEQHKFEIRLGCIFPTITSNKSDLLELCCIFKCSNMLHLLNFRGICRNFDFFFM